ERLSNGRFFDAGDEGEAEEFGYFFKFGEAYPRGQESALYILAELMEPGGWSAAFNSLDRAKFDAPTVEGVAFPHLGGARAFNDDDGTLTVETYAGRRAAAGQLTRFRIANLPNARGLTIVRDGYPFHSWRAVDDSTVEIESVVGTHVFEIRTGWLPGEA